MTRPLHPVLWGLISGILLEYYLRIAEHLGGRRFESGVHLLTLFVLYFALLSIWYILYRFNYSRCATFFLLIVMVVTGITRYAATNHLPIHHISRFVKDERVTIEGFLDKPPETARNFSPNESGKKRYLYVETTWLEQGAFRHRVCGKVRITLSGSLFPHLETKTFTYGDTIRTRLRLSIPKNYDDAGDFNYQEFLRRQGIYLVGYLEHDRYIIKLPKQQGNPLLIGIYTLRDRMIRFLDNYPVRPDQNSSEAIQVIKAMTLGTSRELSSSVKEKFRYAGLYHLLVVSGIHIGILVWVFHQIFHLVHIPMRYRSAFLTIVLLLYAGITGFYFPVLRAVIMALALYFSITWDRISDPLYSLTFSVGLILFISPTALFEVSFQLTVAATASILLLIKFLKHFAYWERFSRFPYLIRLPMITFSMSVGAMIGISPLIVFYFQRLYPYSLLSNLLALPVVSLLLPLSLFSDVLSLLVSWNLIYPLLSVNVILAKCLVFLTGLFPEFDLVPPRPSLPMLIIYYMTVYCGLTFYRRK
jgi:competence protein ComEC